MRHFFILLVLLGLGCLEGKCQEKRRVYVGIDLLKTAVPIFDKHGYYDKATIIEPNLRIEMAERIFLTIQPGYSNIGKKVVYTNFREYENKGGYLKVGLLFSLFDDELDQSLLGLSTGLSLTFSRFKESGLASLEGPTYGDLQVPFSTIRNSFGAEIPLNFTFSLSPRWKLNMQPRINFLKAASFSNDSFPVYYTPGVGSNEQKYQDKFSLPGRKMTGGFTVQLFYKLR